MENPGAFLGLGGSLPAAVRVVGLTLLPAIALAALAASVFRREGARVLSVIGWSLLAGGGLGNLMDRVARGGLVRDFLNFGVGPVRTGILNLADLAVTAGCLLLALHGLRDRRDPCSTSR